MATLDQVDLAAIAALLGGPVGANSVTLTFEDAGGGPVPLVRFNVVGQGPGRADVDGEAAFGLANGTYTVVAEATNGTLFANAELIVDGTTTLTITGTAVTITPAASPAQTTAYTYTRNGGGTLTAGMTVKVRLVDPSPSAADPADSVDAWKRRNLEDTSGGDFLCEFTLAKGATYQHKVEGGEWSTAWTIPADAGGTYEMPEVLGEFGSA